MSPRTVTPYWVKKASMDKFVSLKMKLTQVIQAKAEIDRFVDEEMPEDNQLACEYKSAQKRADTLQTNLQSACNELSALTVIADESFGDEFFGSISAFVEETRLNEKARNKVSDMKSRLTNRGVVTHQTNISSDQVKSQLPIFNGESSLSILDASDTWMNILKNSGIHRQIWGTMILERIKEPALSSIPLTTKREQKFDDICKELSQVYGGAIEVGHNIINAHLKARSIPDPSYHPEAALKVLTGYYECMEHAARFIELSKDANAEAEIMTGSNLKQILSLMPLRIRQEDDSLNTAETNVVKRKTQYMKIKAWVGKIQQKLIMAGTKRNEATGTQIAMVTLNEQPQGRSQNNSSGNYRGYRGNRTQRPDGRRYKSNVDGSPVTECGFCNLIQGKEVSQEYLTMGFNE